MNRRLGCVLLAAVMLSATLLAGCQSNAEGTVTVANNAKTRTVTLTAVTDESTTEEAILRIQDAMNVLSKSLYKTQVVLVLKTADEYEDYIDQANKHQVDLEEEAASLSRVAKEEAKKKKEEEAAEAAKRKIRSKWTTTAVTEAEETEEPVETVLDEYGRQVLKYPEADEYQLDIVFMTGSDMFHRFFYKEYLTEISADLISACAAKKDLTKYIFPTFIKAGKMYDAQYAYANNHLIDNFTYLLVDKTLADRYGFTPGATTQLKDCETFLDDVKANEPNYTPLNYVPDMAYLDYFGDKPALLGSVTNSAYTAATKVTLQNLFVNQDYIAYNVLKDKLEKGSYTATGAADEKFALQVVEGYYNSPETNKWADNYYVVNYETPRASNDSIYKGMFGISAYSKNPDRALAIISMLNTDPDFINLFAYGVEGVDYTLNEDGTAHRLNAGYSMELENCGNSYMAHVPEGKPADLWEIAKVQNLEKYTKNVAPFTFMSLEYEEKAFENTIPQYIEYSDRYMKGLAAATDKAAYFESIQRELEISALLREALNETSASSVTALYSSFYDSMY